MGRPVVHFEIGCRDSAKTQEFYSKLFDWKISPMGPAAMIAPEGSGIAGHISALGHEPQGYTIFYVDVGELAGLSDESGRARRQNVGAARGASDNHVCLDAGSRGEYGRALAEPSLSSGVEDVASARTLDAF